MRIRLRLRIVHIRLSKLSPSARKCEVLFDPSFVIRSQTSDFGGRIDSVQGVREKVIDPRQKPKGGKQAKYSNQNLNHVPILVEYLTNKIKTECRLHSIQELHGIRPVVVCSTHGVISHHLRKWSERLIVVAMF